jgi:ribosomal protein S12 methylthiotransferase accessory factor
VRNREQQLRRNKFKDELPIRTINRIRGLLGDLGIFTAEEGWRSHAGEFYSVSIRIPHTRFRANGKGTRPQFALASAYGEFMERLQNLVFTHFDRDYEERHEWSRGFYLSPDEKRIPFPAACKALEGFSLRGRIPLDARQRIDSECLEQLSADVRGCGHEVLLSIPFYSASRRDTVCLPWSFLKYYCGTNGMCAGNTAEEAAVQGLAEVLERYVNRTVLEGGVTPPVVARACLMRIEPSWRMIEAIESTGRYKVMVKDCSLDADLPVVGLVLVDRTQDAYFVKFGAHPCFDIALERCLVELLQGKDLDSFHGLTRFRVLTDAEARRVSARANVESVYTRGAGVYPSEFFSDIASYPVRQVSDHYFGSNKAVLRRLVDSVGKLGHDVLIRDSSFLGFPAYWVVVPGMSELYSYSASELRNIGAKRSVREAIRKLPACSEEEFRAVLDFLGEAPPESEAIADLTGLPIRPGFSWKSITYNVFLACVHYRLGDVGKAQRYVENHLEYLERIGNDKSEAFRYYTCVRNSLLATGSGSKADHVRSSLSRIHSDETLRAVESDLADPEQIFKHYGRITCWDCANCPSSRECDYELSCDLLSKLKEAMELRPIDQARLWKLLS